MITIAATIFVIGLLVFVHELGHFVTAKAVGMRVHEFALGFGPKLISKQYKETLYSIRIIPLGGFNKIAGMDPDEEQDEYSFNAKPIWARMMVIAAGSFMNFVLPVFLFMLVFLAVGIDKVSEEPIIGKILPDKPAIIAGLAAGDKILAVDGEPIGSWRQLVGIIQTNPQKSLTIDYERDNKKASLVVTPEFDEKNNRGIIGVVPVVTNYQPGFIEAAGMSVGHVYTVIKFMIVGIGQMITGKAAADIAGPIGVAQMAGEVAKMGFLPLLQFAAFLSINLGLINLLPVPALDGGHIITLTLEAVRRKPIDAKNLQIVQTIGFALLIMLLIFATFKDVTRIKLF